MPNRIIKSGNKRFLTYVAVGVVMLAGLVATLIMMDKLTMDDVNQWIALVIALVMANVGLGQSLLSAFNTKRDHTGVAGVEEPPDYKPPTSRHAAD